MSFLNLGSIRKNLTLLVLLTILPAVVILFYSGMEQRQKTVENTKKSILLMAHTISHAQEDVTLSVRQILSTLALTTEIQNLDIQATHDILKNILEQNPNYRNITLVDLSGNVLTSAIPFKGVNLADRKHVRDALKTKDFATGEYILTRIGSATPAFPFAYPVLDAMGTPKAVLTAVITLAVFSKLRQHTLLPKNSYVDITDHQGARLFHYPANATNTPAVTPIKVSKWKTASEIQEPRIMTSSGSDGTTWITAFEPVRLDANTAPYMYVWASVPEAFILTPANSILKRNLLFILLTTIVALFISWSLGRSTLITPINQLIDTTNEFAKGNLENHIGQSDKIDELERLTASFHTMAEVMSISQQELRKSEEKHRLLFENAPFPYQALDTDGRFIVANLNWLKTLGYSADEVIGQWFGDFLSVEDQKAFADDFQTLKSSGYIHNAPYKLRHKQGHYLDIILEGCSGYTPEGDFIQTYCIFQDVSEKKHAEEKIRQSERKFRRLADFTHNWEYWINPEGEYTYVSPSCERISGYRPDEFMSNPNLLFDITKDGYTSGIYQHYKDESLSKNPEFSLEFQITAKNGEVRWLQHHCIPIFDEEGNFAGRRGSNRDITQEKQERTARILSEEKFSRIFKLSPDAISLTRVTDGTYIDVNQGVSEILGWKEEEIIGRSSIDLELWYHKNDRDRVVSELEAHGEINGLEILFQRKDKSIRNGIFSARFLQVNDENYILSITRDITVEKKNKDAIIKAKEEWEATFDAMSDIVTIHDRDMRVVRANKAAHDFFGANYGQLNGKKCCEAFWGSESNCLGCPLLVTMKNGKPCSEILSYNPPDKTLLVTTTPIPNKSGQPEYYIHIARDITEQQQLEKEVSRATRLASLGELAAGVAHEINNPNALILYNSDILGPMIKDLLHFIGDNPPVDPEQLFGGLPYRDVANEIPILLPTIHDSAQRIKRIVNDLRDFTRQDSSSADEVVDLNQVVQAAVRLTHNTIKKATDYFEINLAETLPAITGVPGRLNQVIINLVINACQALGNRSQRLSISTTHAVETDQIKVIVIDEGQGMSADIVEHIFEPFMTTKREQGGTGLGLSVSARIVKEHHGTLSFISAPGEGTTATISLPVRKENSHES